MNNFYIKNLFLIICTAFILSSCGGAKKNAGYYKVGSPYTIAGKTYTPKVDKNYDEVGVASWYGSDFHAKETANGAVFDRNSLSAAHKTLPLPSMVRVTNLNNDKSLIVMVNDRGPFSKNRIIDLSEKAAAVLGFKDKGIAKVRVEYLPDETKRLLASLPKTAKRNLAAAEEKPGLVAKFFNTAGETEAKIDNSKNIDSDKTDKIVTKNIVAKPIAEKAVADTAFEETKSQTKSKSEEIVEKAATENDAEAENTSKKPSTKEAKAESQAPTFFVQAGTYSVIENAKKAERKLAALGDTEILPIDGKDKTLYKVKIGPLSNRKIAELALKKAIVLGHPDAMVVSD